MVVDKRKIVPAGEQLVKISSISLPSWQLDAIEEIGEKWRKAVAPERVSNVQVMRTIVGAGLIEVGRMVARGDHGELTTLARGLRRAAEGLGVDDVAPTAPVAQEPQGAAEGGIGQ